MADYLTVEGRTEQEIDTELAESASEGIKIQLVLDAIAEQESIDVSDDEFGHEIVHRAQRIGMSPQAYYDRLVRDGAAAAVYSDVRRGKALSKVLELVKITDSTGAELSLAELRGAEGNDEPDEHHPAAAALGTETSDH